MVRLYRLQEVFRSAGEAKRNPRDDDFDGRSKRLAREVLNTLKNEGALVSLDEARSILQAENSNASEFRCASCAAPITDMTARECPNCGGSKAMIAASSAEYAYACERCGTPIRDPSATRACPRCGHGRAVARS